MQKKIKMDYWVVEIKRESCLELFQAPHGYFFDNRNLIKCRQTDVDPTSEFQCPEQYITIIF